MSEIVGLVRVSQRGIVAWAGWYTGLYQNCLQREETALDHEKNDNVRECAVQERNTDHWHGHETFRVGCFIESTELRMANEQRCQETCHCA